MPELPEVETVRRGLQPVLEGRVLADVVQRRPDLRFPLPARLAERLRGRRVARIGRRAKFLLLELDDGQVLILHLGMSGRMTIHRGDAGPPDSHDHLEFVTDNGVTVRFNDARRFGMADFAPSGNPQFHPMLAGLGPEPLGNEFSAAALAAALAGRHTPIKAALLDQRVVAGLGNIYACEALHRSGISPRRSAHTIPGVRAERLVTAIRDVLSAAIAAGGSSLRDYVQASGELGYFQHSWQAYGREGEACPKAGCAGTIRRMTQSGRSTFYCAAHQR
ncbi:MAG: bifunctional DNA-formamidopyrimidine glycosylase/DNA-(apurinic or apyrimidinic site) lyase [Alphaproteobacteria bacterium]|nr:bifunctional DNA-formamidopyrimidine glycosylase/DNA-(apurinic or apyrimidinic site) lyase [Alphaproteobacteria bacterium]